MSFQFGPPKPLSEIMFDKFDTDKSGSISAAEFQVLCFQLGYPLSQVEQALALKVLDDDASGQIDRKEFVAWWKRPDRWESIQLSGEILDARKEAAEKFNEFDKDKKGILSAASFDAFYNSIFSSGLTKKDKKTALADLDKNGDGTIQFSEYVEWLGRQGSLKGYKLPEK